MFETSFQSLTTDKSDVRVPPGSAQLEVRLSGTVQLAIDFADFLVASNVEELRGTTPDGFELTARGPWLESCEAQMPADAPPSARVTLMAHEFTLSAKPATHQPWTRKVLYVHGPHPHVHGEWSHGPFTFRIRSLSQTARRVQPALLTIEAEPARIPVDDDLVQRATLDLLSVANRKRCSVFLEQTYRGADLIETRATAHPNVEHGTHPLVDLMNDVPRFVSTSMAGYLQNREDYSLEKLVEYYCLSHGSGHLERRFIYSSVFMEALKFHWAVNVGRLPQDRKQNGMIRGFLKPSGKSYSFQELVDLTAKHLGLQHSYTFIDDRNALYHTGEASGTQTGASDYSQALVDEMRPLQDQVDEILMKLFGYSGTTQSYWNNYRRVS